MATEYEKTRSYERGTQGKSARSSWSLKTPDKDEYRSNQQGQRDRIYLEKRNGDSSRKR